MRKKENFANTEFLPAIKREYSRLPKGQQKIAEFILQHPEKTVRCSISQLMKATNTRSESAIVRFYREFGFTGYNDMKVTLAMELAQNSYYRPFEAITAQDSLGEIKNKIFTGAMHNLERNMAYVSDSSLEQALAILAGTKRLYIMGFAISYAVAEMAFFKFSKLIPMCQRFCDPHTAAAMTALPSEGDTFFAISHSGESRDLIAIAKEMSPPAKIISLTSFADSPLANVSHCKLVLDSEENYRTDAALARLSQLAVVETLFLGLSIAMGQDVLPMLDKSHLAVARLKY